MSELREDNLEQLRFEELERRYKALYDYAKDQQFVVVYRTEGDSSWTVDRSGVAARLQGTWYTDRFAKIAGLKRNIEEMSGMPAKVYSLIVPKSLLDSRDPMMKGMDEVNVLSQDLLGGRKEMLVLEENMEEPTLEEYLNQSAFVREYLGLKKKKETL